MQQKRETFEDRPLEDVVYFLLERTLRRARLVSQHRMDEAELGITVDQWVTLKRISGSEGLSQVEIAEGTLKDAPTITRILDLLKKKGLITKKMDEADRRRFKIHLTDAGRALVERAMPLVYELRQQGLQGLTDEEFLIMKKALNKMYDNLT